MQVYPLPSVRMLPADSSWFNPGGMGAGDALVEELVQFNQGEARSLVTQAEWTEKKPSKSFNYTIPPLMGLKSTLDAEKRPMDTINADPAGEDDMRFVADQLRPEALLKRADGMVASAYGLPVVTNAYLKLIEILPLVVPAAASGKPAEKHSDRQPYYSFHMAEAPGNFVLALNHYLYSRRPDLHSFWEWRANSIEPIQERRGKKEQGTEPHHGKPRRSGYLGDDYGIISRYRDRWLLGADGDGDITSPDNLRSFAQDQPSPHLVTSDVKVVFKGMDYNREEQINLPVQMAHLVGGLYCLRPGGSLVLKEFTKFESLSVSLLILLCHCFEEVRLVKPESSRPANSEIYLVATGYSSRPSEAQFEVLFNFLRFIRFPGGFEDGYPALFPAKYVHDQTEFLKEHVRIQGELVEKQCAALQRNYKLYEELRKSSRREMEEKVRAKNRKLAEAWMKRNPLERLPAEFQLIAQAAGRPRPGRRAADAAK